MDNKKTFDYVVARPWDKKKPMVGDNVCIYTFHNEIQTGNLKHAESFLDYVKRNSDKDEKKDYKIYKITLEELK